MAMHFRQLFEAGSCSYTYLLGSRGQGLLIDPVLDNVDQYLQLLRDLDLTLVFAADTHTHADHITALGALRESTGCVTLMGEQCQSECVSRRLNDGERFGVGDVEVQTLYTPGHTNESYSFVMSDRVFTGDALLIRGTGRTDFQNGDPYAAYDSLFNKLLRLPDETLVYPGHDYKGWTVSTIGEERAHNPRLQVKSAAQYAAMMQALKLPTPAQMDVAVPANLRCGRVA